MKDIKKIFLLTAAVLTISITSQTQEGVHLQVGQPNDFTINTASEIAFGQSAFLSEGSLKLYGELIRNAINARFKRINKDGGIKKKTLRLVSMDDAGEPKQTAKNIAYMRSKKIDMFFGNMGTRSVLEVLDQIERKEIAMFFPWGGDERLRNPKLTHIANGLGLIQPQIEALVEYAINTLRLTKVAIFHDDGSFGIQNKNLMVQSLAAYKIQPVAIASYNRFTMDIVTPAKALVAADPKIVLCSATDMPTVKLINFFLGNGHYGTRFVGIDSTMFVGTILKRKGVPFFYASPMPHPTDSNHPIVKQFRKDMKEFFPNDPLNVLSLAYYIHAAIITEAIKTIEGAVTKEAILEKVALMKNYDLGGFSVNFNEKTRHAYDHNISILSGTTTMVAQPLVKDKQW